MNRVALAGLLMAFALTALAPDNAAAQTTTCPTNLTDTWPDNTLCLGEVSGINLNLIFPVTTSDGKIYYHVDHNGNGTANTAADSHVSTGDGVTGQAVDNLFNGGNDVRTTQEAETNMAAFPPTAPGNHDGTTDDARWVKVGRYALVLPTVNELNALRKDSAVTDSCMSPCTLVTAPGNNIGTNPVNWGGSGQVYRTANLRSSNEHYLFDLRNGPPQTPTSDSNLRRLAVQVFTTPATKPAAPTDVTATPTTNGTLRIDWITVPEADNGGATITTYTATATNRGDNSNTATCTADGTATDGTDTNCTISGLTNTATYDVVVVATNSVGDSDPSEEVGVVVGTPAPPPTSCSSPATR